MIANRGSFRYFKSVEGRFSIIHQASLSQKEYHLLYLACYHRAHSQIHHLNLTNRNPPRLQIQEELILHFHRLRHRLLLLQLIYLLRPRLPFSFVSLL